MLGEALALAAAATWAVSVILFKRSEAISPQGMNLFKNVCAAALLAATLPLIGGSIDWQRSSDDWWRLVASGVLGIAIADTLVFVALRRLGASLLAVVDCAYAPVIVGMSVLFLGERVGISFAFGAVLVVGGVLLAVRKPPRHVADTVAHDWKHLAGGIAYGVTGIVSMAIGVILAKPVLERSGLVEVTFVRLLAGIAGQLLWLAFVQRDRTAFAAFRPSPVWRTLVPASVLGSYVAMLLWLGGFKWAHASVAAVLNQMSAVFTIVLARVVLGEPLNPSRALGSAAAVAGAIIVLT
jgi:drug/metabolite transporter (DMT)-like permease